MTSKKQEFLNYYLEAKSKATYKSYKRGLALNPILSHTEDQTEHEGTFSIK